MSADNGIYIHKFRAGWRVTHAQAIDNIYWHRGKNRYNYRILKQYFEDSPLFDSIDKARDYAFQLAATGWTEYGVCDV